MAKGSVSSDPKTARGRRFIALDVGTVSALRAQRVAQAQERLMSGAEYVDHDLVFARPDGLASTVVQERLGHSTIGITPDVYSHVLPSMETDAATGSRR